MSTAASPPARNRGQSAGTQHPGGQNPPPLPTDPAELERLIRGQQNQLASSVTALVDKVSPKNVAQRTVADLKERGRAAVLTPSGEPRVERLAAVGAGAAGLVALLVLNGARKRRRRGRREVEKAAKRGRKRADD
ncbi:DUF3618 domain-containing protein [Pseudokineococcus basanitobsidens]|uniref:DUF3618 domain-containing protein n=1 Tax=Pseudokineococcus basanitobsidens TaxID=1926649 RepID=A0ABU8RJI4_9ACTN